MGIVREGDERGTRRGRDGVKEKRIPGGAGRTGRRGLATVPNRILGRWSVDQDLCSVGMRGQRYQMGILLVSTRRGTLVSDGRLTATAAS